MPNSSHRFYAGAPKETREAERARFNALSQEDAAALLKEMEGKESDLRSCWYCNAGHDHLKTAEDPINCLWGCGLWYLKGFPAPVVVRRAKGEEVMDETMQKFEAALAAS